MSFTADIYKKLILDIKSNSNQTSQYAMRMERLENGIDVVYSIDRVTLMRGAYFSIKTTKTKLNFPEWKGVEIQKAKIPAYGTQNDYIGLSQLPNSANDIFEAVVEDISRSLKEAQNINDSLPAITNVLSKWKNFFLSSKNVILTKERQQGLYGELLFLKECTRKLGSEAITHWAGCADETHDFYFGAHAVEVKTTSTQEPYYVHISSEYQLDNNDVPGNLYLRFFALRKSESSGEKLADIIENIRKDICDDEAKLHKFNEKLNKYGYFDEVKESYSTGYFVRDNYCYDVIQGFPRITKNDIPKGVSKLKYNISTALCIPFIIDIQNVFKVIEGGPHDGE